MPDADYDAGLTLTEQIVRVLEAAVCPCGHRVSEHPHPFPHNAFCPTCTRSREEATAAALIAAGVRMSVAASAAWPYIAGGVGGCGRYRTRVTPRADCDHGPRYSRSECVECGQQEAWCDECDVRLCGCVTSPGK